MRRTATLVALATLLFATAAQAYWSAGGSGSGSGLVSMMPAGNQPAGTASSQSVTVTWTQSTVQGNRIGSLANGGYTLRRYAQGSATGVTPNASCATKISGSTSSLQCVESGVPYGTWQYTVKPVLGTFTGDEGPKSATLVVAPSAPSLTTVAAQNPTAGQTTGDVQVTWGSVTGATGYNVYRRTAAGSYNFGAPLNGATPYTAGTTYTDPGTGLTGATTYDYVVRAVAGSPVVESASSNEKGDAAIARPAAPAGGVTAVAAVGGRIDVTWSSVAGAAGYNVYRRTSAGAYNLTTPLNGASALAGTTYQDSTATNGTAYLYVVRTVITGAGGAQVESASSSESGSATSDATAPPVPTGLTVTSGGNVTASTICSVATGTRFVNNAGKGSVSITATIAAPESGETVLFTATTPGSTPVTTTVAASGTSVSTTRDLTTLLDGTLTITAQTKDLAGNLSATKGPANAVVKDVVGAPLSGVTYHDNALSPDTISGTSECGATVTAVETAGNNVGRAFPASPPFTVPASGAFTGFQVEANLLITYGYTVTAADMAGNP
ncbi:MAG: lipoprotein cytochrome c, partial [Solirubrobacterales bacterium]|nr:lipoprotein cytochrome c [Solirubrobacterales bacterium]